MSDQNFRVQFLRGSAAENDAYVGREGELTIDLDNFNIRLHDGSTPGGVAFVKLSELNALTSTIDSLDTSVTNIQSQIDNGEIGSGGESVTIQVDSWSGNAITVPTGVTVTKEYDNSSLRITHNKGQFPTGWFAFNRESDPMTGITPSSLRNIQIVDDNSVIITSVSSFEVFDITLTF